MHAHAVVSFSACLALVGISTAQIAGSFQTSGEGCPDDSLLYEAFDGGAFDLAGMQLEWFPNGQLGYVAIASPGAMLPTAGGSDLMSGDEEVLFPPTLNFAFPYPTGNGSTQNIDVSSNGYVYLESGTILDTRPVIDLLEFRNETPSFAVFGGDWDPSSGGNVWFNQNASTAWITWENVMPFSGGVVRTFQAQLHSDGRVSFVYDSQPAPAMPTLVGWSGGGGRDDDGSADFSAGPIDMGPASGPLTISVPPARLPITGHTFDIDVDNVPADATVAALLLGAFPLQVDLDALGMTGCDLLTAADIGAIPITLTAPIGTVALPLPTTPGTAGLVIETQAAAIAPSVNTFGVSTSNAATMTVGDIAPVIVRAQGVDNFNADTTQGFWRVVNAGSTPITNLRLSWIGSSVPNTNYFDTAQINMANRFDGGNSTTPLCLGTYRNDSDTTVGLAYGGTLVSPCNPANNTGWVGSVLGLSAGQYRILDFSFAHFDPGEVFEFDADTDPGPGSGAAMAGLVVTVTLAGGATRTGELAMVDPVTAEVVLP